MPHRAIPNFPDAKNPNFEDSIELSIADLSSASEVFSAQKIRDGEQVIGMVIVPQTAVGSGTAAVTVNRNGTAISGLAINVTSSLTAGTQSEDILATPLELAAGDVLSVETDGGSSGTAPANVSILFKKNFRT